MTNEMKDTPRTKRETERQKGPIPLVAILLVLGLLAAFLLFFVPALVGAVSGE